MNYLRNSLNPLYPKSNFKQMFKLNFFFFSLNLNHLINCVFEDYLSHLLLIVFVKTFIFYYSQDLSATQSRGLLNRDIVRMY